MIAENSYLWWNKQFILPTGFNHNSPRGWLLSHQRIRSWMLAHSQALAIVIHKCHKARHSGMDSHQAILPDALRVNANLFLTDLCRNPVYMDVFEITIHGTGYPLPGGYDGFLEVCV